MTIQLPPLTEKQKEIIILMYRYRFLTRTHIQIFLNHQSSSLTNHWLTDLTTKNYLNRIYIPTLGENTKPAIYFLTTNAIRYLMRYENLERKRAQNLYYEHKRLASFRTHCLILADFACSLLIHMRKQQKKALFLTKVDYIQETDNPLFILLQQVKPDGYYTYNGTGIAQEAFITVIDKQTPARVLRAMIGRYQQASTVSDLDLFDSSRFPSLIFLLPTIKKLHSLQRIIQQLKNANSDEQTELLRCNLALASDLQKKSLATDIWIPA